ncbi:MAG: hypothetical protein QM680_07685 [Luteolibacter sp.]
MTSPLSAGPLPTPQRLHFLCPHCHQALSVGAELAGVQGPCPYCGGLLTAPQIAVQEAVPQQIMPQPRPARFKARLSTSPPVRSGRVMADGMVDHADLENREFRKTLRILACFILAFAVCLAVSWFLKKHQAGG